jgi:hypothetical protein
MNSNCYKGEIKELVFELLDAETFVAGIASTLLEGQCPERAAMPILETTFLFGTCWMRRDGSQFDLRATPEVLDHARRVEALKDACAALILSPRAH